MQLGPVMVDIKGYDLENSEKDYLLHPQVGGVILFSRNYQSPEQLKRLVADIKALRDPALLIAVDQEGGRIQRFVEGFSKLPSARQLGQLYDQDAEKGINYSYQAGWLMAVELLALGIDFSFAPVLDIDYGLSKVISDRSFHSDFNIVIKLADAFMQGMHIAGMIACGKHFPGHGGVIADSHLELPIDTRALNEIEQKDIVPFKALIARELDSIMLAHIVYENIDAMPSGFSSYWVNYVRNTLGFTGVLFSDDLSMQATEQYGNYPKRAQLALAAGCDMILVCNNSTAIIEVLTSLEKQPIDENISQKLLHLRRSHHWYNQDLLAFSQWQNAKALLQDIV